MVDAVPERAAVRSLIVDALRLADELGDLVLGCHLSAALDHIDRRGVPTIADLDALFDSEDVAPRSE